MAGEMFGAPIGISAAEDQINQNALAGLKAQQLLGDISKQPAEKALAEAHARLYGAEAAVKESQARDLAAMQEFERAQAVKKAANAAAGKGTLMTVGDLDETGRPKQRSLADPYLELITAADEAGMPLRLTAPIRERAALIQQREAAAGHSAAGQELQQIEKQAKVAEQISSMATAVLERPETYDQARMEAARRGFPVDRLPATFNRAALETLRDFGIKSLDKLRLKATALKDEDTKRLHTSMIGKNSAAVKLAGMRYNLAKQKYDDIVKNGGKDSESAREARASMVRRREALTFKDLDARYPQAPVDPAKRVLKETYRTKSGQLFRWEKDAQGNVGAVVIPTPKGLEAVIAQSVARAAAKPTAEAESEAEDADEGEEE